jgi:AcrR family transcriptional regulator
MTTDLLDHAQTPAPADSTADRILDVARDLFGEQGFAATSTRAIALAAGVNLAQLHYYYGSKRDLFKAAYLRGAEAITRAREEALERAGWPNRELSLEQLVRSFVAPFMLAGKTKRGQAIMRMHARLHAEPDGLGEELLSLVFDKTTLAYTEAFERALPHVPTKTLYWRLYFTMGAYRYTLLRTGRLEALSRGTCDSSDFDTALDQIVPFLCAGLAAPP